MLFLPANDFFVFAHSVLAVGVGGEVVTEEGNIGPAQVVDAVEKPVGFETELRNGEVFKGGEESFGGDGERGGAHGWDARVL